LLLPNRKAHSKHESALGDGGDRGLSVAAVENMPTGLMAPKSYH